MQNLSKKKKTKNLTLEGRGPLCDLRGAKTHRRLANTQRCEPETRIIYIPLRLSRRGFNGQQRGVAEPKRIDVPRATQARQCLLSQTYNRPGRDGIVLRSLWSLVRARRGLCPLYSVGWNSAPLDSGASTDAQGPDKYWCFTGAKTKRSKCCLWTGPQGLAAPRGARGGAQTRYGVNVADR
ncbi:hypothetical protein LX36DRAFT_358531 [Colletotrichum falcatum]|nr:hypothetical protein LX36DRAFT_358531 [Colletotrichum falcatum]